MWSSQLHRIERSHFRKEVGCVYNALCFCLVAAESFPGVSFLLVSTKGK